MKEFLLQKSLVTRHKFHKLLNIAHRVKKSEQKCKFNEEFC